MSGSNLRGKLLLLGQQLPAAQRGLPSAPSQAACGVRLKAGTEKEKGTLRSAALRVGRLGCQRWQTDVCHRKFITDTTASSFSEIWRGRNVVAALYLFPKRHGMLRRGKDTRRGPASFARDEKSRSWVGGKSRRRTFPGHSIVISFQSSRFFTFHPLPGPQQALRNCSAEYRSLSSSSKLFPLYHACSCLTMD